MHVRIQRHPIASFFVLAYVFSWSIALPLALQSQRVLDTHLPLWLHYLTAFGPALAAWVVSRSIGGSTVARSADREYATVRWFAIGLLSPLALFAMARGVAAVVGQPVSGWVALGRVNFLPDLGVAAWMLWFLTSGVGEELGWRGFALPHMQQQHSALVSSVLIAIGWAGWHLPAFYYLPGYAALGVVIVPGFFVGIVAGSIVLTSLFNSSGGRILTVVLWHASFNYVTASPNAAGFAAGVTSALVIVWAAAILLFCDVGTLTRWRIHGWRQKSAV